MTTAALLLPRNATAYERALATALTDVLPVPIRSVVDPQTAPVAFLPFTAEHESVDLWFEDWAVQRKRDMIEASPVLATLKGTRDGTVEFLRFVDAEVLDIVAHPSRFVFRRAVVARTPIGHPAFVARHLVRVHTIVPPRAFVIGRAVVGRARLRTPSREPFRRVLVAMRVAKSPDTEYRVDFAHKRQLQLSDGSLLSDDFLLGQFIDRSKL